MALVKLVRIPSSHKSSTKDGKRFLDMAPYFLYTPTLYVIQKGMQNMLNGYNESDNQLVYVDVIQLLISDLAYTRILWSFRTYE